MTRSVLITGASRGIGQAIALRMAQHGDNLHLVARNESALSAVARQCRSTGSTVGCTIGDLGEQACMDAAVADALSQFGAIDVLINNAGAALHEPVQSADLPAWHAIMDVNFNAIVYLTRQILPAMIDRKQGAIINISSIAARHTAAGMGAYSASKHALNGFSGCLYEDVRDYGIKVSTIMPGFVSTDLTSGMGMSDDNMIRADDVADSVDYVLSASANCCPTEIVLRPQRRP